MRWRIVDLHTAITLECRYNMRSPMWARLGKDPDRESWLKIYHGAT